MTQQQLTLNLLDPGFRDNPYPMLAALRERDPVHRVPWGAWAITRYKDVNNVLRDKRMSRDMRNWSGYAAKATWKDHPEIEQLAPKYLINTDPPVHSRLRALMASAFTPASVRALLPRIESIARALIERLPQDEPFDLMESFALPLPVQVICGLFGFPVEDYALLRRWSDAFAPFVEMTVSRRQKDEMRAAVLEFHEYLRPIIAERRKDPGDALVDKLIQANVDGEQLSEPELLMSISGMLFAGHETTANTIGNGLLALLRSPEQLELLRARPDLLSSAVRECLRYDGSSNIVIRVAGEDIELAGKAIRKGDVIMCMMGAANRDPEQFPEPDRFDITRDAGPHTTYGGGRHHCIGAQLANLEIEVAFRELLARFSRLELVEGGVQRLDRVNLRGLARLTVRGAR